MVQAKPPTWAKKATPPPLALALVSPKLASMSWYRNHSPRKTQAGTLKEKMGHHGHEAAGEIEGDIAQRPVGILDVLAEDSATLATETAGEQPLPTAESRRSPPGM
jgi:hypothetical protein